MKTSEIHIRDPFVLAKNGVYYMYGTRAKDTGETRKTGGLDVYVSRDLENWDGPRECFSSRAYGLDRDVNWAPEVYAYCGAYYMFATFTKENGLRGTYAMRAERPEGPFVPHSDGALTPYEWECLDGTLYVESGVPYLVFCHEHTQITDGTMCRVRLSFDLSRAVESPVTMFAASEPFYVEKRPEGEHYVTDGPFMYRTENGTLLMIWSTFLGSRYAECLVRFEGGSIKSAFEHLPPLSCEDGGHGMIFRAGEKKYLVLHRPNVRPLERPVFIEIKDLGDTVALVK